MALDEELYGNLSDRPATGGFIRSVHRRAGGGASGYVPELRDEARSLSYPGAPSQPGVFKAPTFNL